GPGGVATEDLVAVNGDVLVTALKGAEDGDAVVLRVVAAAQTQREVDTPCAATTVRLDEAALVGAADGPLRAGEIRTVRLTRRILAPAPAPGPVSAPALPPNAAADGSPETDRREGDPWPVPPESAASVETKELPDPLDPPHPGGACCRHTPSPA